MRPILLLVIGALLVFPAPARATSVGCELSILKATGKLTDKTRKALRRCEPAAVDGTGVCPDVPAVATIAAERAKLVQKVARGCGGPDATCGTGDDEPLATIGWAIGTCPSPRPSCMRPIANCSDIAECLTCNADASVATDVATCFGVFAPSDDAAVRRCQSALCKETFKFASATTKALEGCWKGRARGAAGQCPNPSVIAAFDKAETKMHARICAACGGDGQCGGVDDITATDLYGAPLACPNVTFPGGGRSCAGTATTLSEVNDCLACATAQAVDCIDALRVPWAMPYPAECAVERCAHPAAPLDIVFANLDGPNRICEGSGTGTTFTCRNVDDTTWASSGVVAVDLDGDHDLDLVFSSNTGTSNVRCLNDGAANFTCAPFSDAGFYTDVAAGDLDGDGIPDVVFSRAVAGIPRVCLGDGSGGFTCTEIDAEPGDYNSVTIADVNADGLPDLVFPRSGGGRSRLCIGTGHGNFSCRDVSTDEDDAMEVAAGDVNEDGKLDLVFAVIEQVPPVGFHNRVCLGDGTGGFTCSDVSADSQRILAVALGDVNRDGHLDAVFANFNQGQNLLCLGDGTGAFTCSTAGPDAFATDDVVLADFDGDCTLDALFADASTPTSEHSRLCLNDGSGNFTCQDVASEIAESRGVAVGRF